MKNNIKDREYRTPNNEETRDSEAPVLTFLEHYIFSRRKRWTQKAGNVNRNKIMGKSCNSCETSQLLSKSTKH